jgi:hypothetical protein
MLWTCKPGCERPIWHRRLSGASSGFPIARGGCLGTHGARHSGRAIGMFLVFDDTQNNIICPIRLVTDYVQFSHQIGVALVGLSFFGQFETDMFSINLY